MEDEKRGYEKGSKGDSEERNRLEYAITIKKMRKKNAHQEGENENRLMWRPWVSSLDLPLFMPVFLHCKTHAMPAFTS